MRLGLLRIAFIVSMMLGVPGIVPKAAEACASAIELSTATLATRAGQASVLQVTLRALTTTNSNNALTRVAFTRAANATVEVRQNRAVPPV